MDTSEHALPGGICVALEYDVTQAHLPDSASHAMQQGGVLSETLAALLCSPQAPNFESSRELESPVRMRGLIEGSWVIYLGGGRFSHIRDPGRPSTMHEKCLDLHHVVTPRQPASPPGLPSPRATRMSGRARRA